VVEAMRVVKRRRKAPMLDRGISALAVGLDAVMRLTPPTNNKPVFRLTSYAVVEIRKNKAIGPTATIAHALK
jgi:hypothetical protein